MSFLDLFQPVVFIQSVFLYCNADRGGTARDLEL